MADEMVTITKDEYKRLRREGRILDALVEGGVDNWEGYGFAMENLPDEDEED